MFGTPYRPDNTQPAVEALFPESKHEPRDLELDYAGNNRSNALCSLYDGIVHETILIRIDLRIDF